MKKKINILLTGVAISGLVLSLVGVALASWAKPEPMARKIVVFESGILNESAREALVRQFGGVKVKDLNLIEGIAVLLPPRAEAALAKMAGVLRVDDDVEVFALIRGAGEKSAPSQPPEVLPWGVDRIDADLAWAVTTGDLVKVAIIDTGIDVKHPDLIDNLKGGVSTVWYTTSYNDDNGHGTHVAGIAAAFDNTIGVVGVGPQIDLYAVKVLDRRGSGYLSDVIEGLDWAIANEMKVVNMSLGTASDVQSLHDAVQRVAAAGIVQVAAAGNSGGAVIYPAAYPEVIAVSAIDNTDMIASWSSRGPEVDLSAPGVNIYSTYKSQTYKTLSGTSMAAPHVTGVAALVLSVYPGLLPAGVQQKLENTAEDLGAVGRDDLYGYGLVDAQKAVAP